MSFDVTKIDVRVLVGNILGCCELEDYFVITDEVMQSYIKTLSSVFVGDCVVGYSFGYDLNTLEDVCKNVYSKFCVFDDAAKSFRQNVSNRVNLSEVNDNLPIMYLVFIESYTRWFVAKTFKKERRPFIEYTRSMAQSASMMMDCIRV